MCEALNAAGRDQKLVQLSVLGMSCLPPTYTVPHSFNQTSPPCPSGSTARRGAANPGVAWYALCPPVVTASGQCGVKTLVCRIGQT